MAAAASAQLTFVDKDELPVAFLRISRAVHVDSENEEPSDVDSSASEDSSDKTEEEDDNTEDSNDRDYWNFLQSCHVQAPLGMDFNKDVGIKVDMPANSTCVDHFPALFSSVLHRSCLSADFE